MNRAVHQSIVFLSDGGDTVRELPMYLSPESEHWLDWFHLTMRLTIMGQMAKGLKGSKVAPSTIEGEDALGGPALEAIEKLLESLKWNLWHGNGYRALQRVEDLEGELGCLETDAGNGKKLPKAVREFGGYIEANQVFIPNYGDRYRHGETISTACVESTVNQVVSKRMVKQQQMLLDPARCTPAPASTHACAERRATGYLLHWYPGMEPAPQLPLKEAA